jgi:uncharacterized protein (TIGR02646 family)
MIFIDRSKVVPPDILTNPKKRGQKEKQAAIDHYTGPHKAETYQGFSVYRDAEVKDALIQLFNGKCAYCESVFLHVYSGDVEHYRPKGEITEADPGKPGYYWLAAEWDNLLLSCRNCNQKLAHAIHGERDKKTMGKMNQFPLTDEVKYIRDHNHPNGVNDEEPYRLLLNPCIDHPEEHLEYDGEHAIIKPKKDAAGHPSSKGKTSIDVFVLQRVPLGKSPG